MVILVMQLLIFIFVLLNQFPSHYGEDSNFILLKLYPKLRSQDLSETFSKYSSEQKSLSTANRRRRDIVPESKGFRMFGVHTWPIDFSENGPNVKSWECRGTCIQGICDFESSKKIPKAGQPK